MMRHIKDQKIMFIEKDRMIEKKPRKILSGETVTETIGHSGTWPTRLEGNSKRDKDSRRDTTLMMMMMKL